MSVFGRLLTKGNELVPRQVFASFSFLVLLAFFLNNFWLGDDGFITFRTAHNWVNGYGLRWNSVERVQTYTNTLWLFYITPLYLLTTDIYISALLGSLAAFVALVLILYRNSSSDLAFAIIMLLMVSSKSFLEYTSSGLENVLSFALLSAYFFTYSRLASGLTRVESAGFPKGSWMVSLLFAALFLNRMDSILLVLIPQLILAYHLVRSWRRVGMRPLLQNACAVLPIVLWLLFSLVYYGFFFPNTFYAKTTFAIDSVRWKWVLGYYKYALYMDPLLLVLPAIALALSVSRRGRKYLPFGTGVLLYNAYIIQVGGDFMGGRWLTLPYIISICILAAWWDFGTLTRFKYRDLAVAGLVFVAAYSLQNRLMRYNPFVAQQGGMPVLNTDLFNGVVDERLTLGQFTRITKCLNGPCFMVHPLYLMGYALRAEGESGRIPSGGAMGLLGFAAGPGVRIIDRQGLCDPLLARMEGQPIAPGHVFRQVPDGYDVPGEVISDPVLRDYNERLQIVTRGDLWT